MSSIAHRRSCRQKYRRSGTLGPWQGWGPCAAEAGGLPIRGRLIYTIDRPPRTNPSQAVSSGVHVASHGHVSLTRDPHAAEEDAGEQRTELVPVRCQVRRPTTGGSCAAHLPPQCHLPPPAIGLVTAPAHFSAPAVIAGCFRGLSLWHRGHGRPGRVPGGTGACGARRLVPLHSRRPQPPANRPPANRQPPALPGCRSTLRSGSMRRRRATPRRLRRIRCAVLHPGAVPAQSHRPPTARQPPTNRPLCPAAGTLVKAAA